MTNVGRAEAGHDLMDATAREAFVVRHVLALSAENRSKLLMFFYLAEHAEGIRAEASIKGDGVVELRLTYQAR